LFITVLTPLSGNSPSLTRLKPEDTRGVAAPECPRNLFTSAVADPPVNVSRTLRLRPQPASVTGFRIADLGVLGQLALIGGEHWIADAVTEIYKRRAV